MSLYLNSFIERFRTNQIQVLSPPKTDWLIEDLRVMTPDSVYSEDRADSIWFLLPFLKPKNQEFTVLIEHLLHSPHIDHCGVALAWDNWNSKEKEQIAQCCIDNEIPAFIFSKNISIAKILSLIYTDESERLQKLISKISVNLTEAILQRIPLVYMLGLINAYTGIELAVKDFRTNKMVTSQDSTIFAKNAKTYPLKELNRLYRHKGLSDKREPWGSIFYNAGTEQEIDPFIETVLDFSSNKLEISMYVTDLMKQPREAILDSIFHELIQALPELSDNVRERIEKMGVRVDNEVAVLIISPDLSRCEMEGEDKELFVTRVMSQIQSRLEPILQRCHRIISNSNHVFICILKPETEHKALLHNIKESIYTFLDTKHNKALYYMGFGGLGRELLALHDTYIEAKQSLKISELRPDSNLVIWQELGVDKIISSISETEEASKLTQKFLYPLIRFDEENEADLFRTLQVLESNGWNINQTAQVLQVHYNTVKYRIEKIFNLINVSKDSPKDRFSLTLANYIFLLTKNRQDAK